MTPTEGFRDTIDALEYPDPLVDDADLTYLDRSGEEVDAEAFFRRSRIDSGEKKLMLAVLEDGVAVFQKTADSLEHRYRRQFIEILGWIESNDLEWPFSFVNICHALELDEAHLRSGLHKWREKYAPNSFQPLPEKKRKKRRPKQQRFCVCGKGIPAGKEGPYCGDCRETR